MATPIVKKFSEEYLELRILGFGTTGKGDRIALLSPSSARSLAYALLVQAERLDQNALPSKKPNCPPQVKRHTQRSDHRALEAGLHGRSNS
jgi:hypothetical protein